MLIQQSTYPEFVPDQILSSEHLSRLFGYLEEQERLTRANLLGIGIVCGLEIKTTGTSQITITKGTGITSKGYLVSTYDTIYTGYKEYDVTRNHQYDLFKSIFDDDPDSDFVAYELFPPNTPVAGVTALSALPSLQDYVVMMYVELRAETTADCDTNDCDFEGVMVTVNPKPLLIPKSFISNFTSSASNVGTSITNLPEVALRRFDVAATSLNGSAAIIEGYRKILKDQVALLGTALNATFLGLYPFVSDEYPVNPFTDLISDLFYFLDDDTYPVNTMLHVQYYYDLLSDIYNAFNVIRENGDHLISVCNADESLFPQHLLLGPAVNMTTDGARVEYRNYFMPSGAMQSCCGEVGELRLEFKRLVLLLQKFVLPVAFTDTVGGDAVDAIEVRITPDVLGNVSLSEKSIPFYYEVNSSGTDKLYRYWNYSKTHAGHADRNLSYNAPDYRFGGIDDPVLQPLYYDLEDYNFLRIEGHIGKSYREAVNTILNKRNQYRLPFDVIAIRTTMPADNILKKLCCGDGLELSYDIVRREWEAVIGATIEFINSNLDSAKTLLGFDDADGDETAKYLDKLQKVKTYLVDDASAFMVRYDEFIGKYEEIESESARLRDKVYGQLGEQGGSMYVFGEDLIDHLDEAGHSAKKGAFRALYQAWLGLAASVEETLGLKEYSRVHPGLQHKAGVPMGGTFVIIYHTEGDGGNEDLVRKSAAQSSPPSGSQEPGSVSQMLAKIPEGMVIADFYLPYLCCSDCSPIEVSIGNGKPPVVKPTISIENNISSICLGGQGTQPKYQLTIQPDNANVTATVNGANVSGVVVNDGTNWQFVPSAVTFAASDLSKVVKITVEKDGQTTSLQVTVYAKPVLSFNVSGDGSSPNTKTFNGVTQHAGTVVWDFGDGQTTTSFSPNTPVSHTYATATTAKTYTVTLSATNGVCANQTVSQPVQIEAGLPCGGVKNTCKYIWPYPHTTQQSGGGAQTALRTLETAPRAEMIAQQSSISLSISMIRYSVGTISVPGMSTSINVTTQDFNTNWPIVANYLNNWLGGIPNGISFTPTSTSYSDFGYLIPVTYYPCKGMEFIFEFEFYLVIDGRPQTKYHYLFDNTGTYEVSKDNVTRRFLYKDPNCPATQQAGQQNDPR